MPKPTSSSTSDFTSAEDVLSFLARLPGHVHHFRGLGIEVTFRPAYAEEQGPLQPLQPVPRREGMTGRDGLTSEEQRQLYGRVMDAPDSEVGNG